MAHHGLDGEDMARLGIDPELLAKMQQYSRYVSRKRKERRFRKRLKKRDPANFTRGTFAWKEGRGTASVIQQEQFLPGTGLSKSANFRPVGAPGGLWEVSPRIREKAAETWSVWKTDKGKEKVLLGTGFTKCCQGQGSYPNGSKAYCTATTCANCFVARLNVPKSTALQISRDPYSPNPKNIVDTCGVDPHGKKTGGKSLHPLDAAPWKLTSKRLFYKTKDQKQHDPKDIARWENPPK